ncbi:hypothetical protein [Hymenobacter arizonensis]|uniref:hypothetical protein n=1 Tax=Hymenobacter arizonensis TaxID=1227077 RepID=UPI000B82FAA3|nr:hypothetical protein [Hymenobacter arizonensis]
MIYEPVNYGLAAAYPAPADVGLCAWGRGVDDHDVLPIAAKLTGATIRQHLHAVVEAEGALLLPQEATFHGSSQLEREALPCPARTLVVGLDGS